MMSEGEIDLVDGFASLSSVFEALDEGETLILDAKRMGKPSPVYTCGRFVVELAYSHIGENLRVECVSFVTDRDVIRALGCLLMSVAFEGPTREATVIALPDSRSAVETLTIEHAQRVSSAVPMDLDISVAQFEYSRDVVSLEPFLNRGLEPSLLPCLARRGPTEVGMLNHRDSDRTELVGFGGVFGLVLMGELCLNLSYPESKSGRNEIRLVSTTGGGSSLMRTSAEVVIRLPGSAG